MAAPAFTFSEIKEMDLDDIEFNIGLPPTIYYPNPTTKKVPDTDRPLLRQWLRLKGLDESIITTASDYVLANAYRIGDPYIRKANEAHRNDQRKPKRNFKFGDLNLDITGKQKQIQDLLEAAADNVPDDIRTPSGPNPSDQKPKTNTQFSEADLARAAAAVIGPRVEKAKMELKNLVESQISLAANRFYLSDENKEQIEEAAKEAAASESTSIMERWVKQNQEMLDKLERMVPRRLEIITPKQTRVLPAEPRHKIFDEVLLTLLSDEHVYLVGEAGTGKTHLFHQIGKALDQPTTVLGQTLTKYEFSGHLGPNGDYVPTLLRRAVEEGHLLCIDEIDTSASAAVVFLNSLLANRFVAFPDRMLEAHPQFKVIAAANTFGFGATPQYLGRNPLDAASLDRFTYIECHYDENLERLLYGDNPWTTYVHRVRAATQKLELRHVISMRAIDRGRKLLAAGLDVDRVCKLALWRNLAPDSVLKIQNLAGRFERNLSEAA